MEAPIGASTYPALPSLTLPRHTLPSAAKDIPLYLGHAMPSPAKDYSLAMLTVSSGCPRSYVADGPNK